MNERLLQFIWQFQYFNKDNLQTTENETLTILKTGVFNTNQGPDFLEASIQINQTILVGNIEIHIHTSDWKKHKHTSDKNYQNVILHVVWEHDVDLNLPFPTFVLQSKVSIILLKKYQEWMNNSSFIPCENYIGQIDELTWLVWKERLLIERLETKSEIIIKHLNENKNHWEEIFWWFLAKNFGAKENSEAFESIAKSISINILAKHKSQIHQLEALLLGQAGLLNKNLNNSYSILLQKEYAFLKAKYNLKPLVFSLNFLRMRPANFPTIRLAQLAMLIHKSEHLFAKIKEIENLHELKKILQITANDFWHYHYTLQQESMFLKKKIGSSMINNMIINTIIPILFTYGKQQNNLVYKLKSFQWLQELEAEKNTITTGFKKHNIKIKNSYDSQSLIQLKNIYCNHKLCLQCAIGNKLLKQKS